MDGKGQNHGLEVDANQKMRGDDQLARNVHPLVMTGRNRSLRNVLWNVGWIARLLANTSDMILGLKILNRETVQEGRQAGDGAKPPRRPRSPQDREGEESEIRPNLTRGYSRIFRH